MVLFSGNPAVKRPIHPTYITSPTHPDKQFMAMKQHPHQNFYKQTQKTVLDPTPAFVGTDIGIFSGYPATHLSRQEVSDHKTVWFSKTKLFNLIVADRYSYYFRNTSHSPIQSIPSRRRIFILFTLKKRGTSLGGPRMREDHS